MKEGIKLRYTMTLLYFPFHLQKESILDCKSMDGRKENITSLVKAYMAGI